MALWRMPPAEAGTTYPPAVARYESGTTVRGQIVNLPPAVPVVDLADPIASKEAANRDKDKATLPELRRLLIELCRLRAELDGVRQDATGRLLAIRGRRQVGKSRLLTEMVERSGVAYLYTTAAKHAPAGRQLEQVMTDLRAARRTSRLPRCELSSDVACPERVRRG